MRLQKLHVDFLDRTLDGKAVDNKKLSRLKEFVRDYPKVKWDCDESYPVDFALKLLSKFIKSGYGYERYTDTLTMILVTRGDEENGLVVLVSLSKHQIFRQISIRELPERRG